MSASGQLSPNVIGSNAKRSNARRSTFDPPAESGKRSEVEITNSEALDAQRLEAIGRLVGGVAHDFNNLLTGIMLYCDLLAAGLGNAEGSRRYVEEIRRASEGGGALIQQLLAVARRQAIEAKLLSLNEVIAGMSNLLGRLIGEDIELTTELAGDLRWVKMDPAQAQQVILNLVLNARDAMPEGGRITLATGNCGAISDGNSPALQAKCAVELTVRDNGSGMSAETLAHLFEPNFTTKALERGHGLGLATVRGIIEQRGGAIEVESEAGRGTRVSIWLPAEAQMAAASAVGEVLNEAMLHEIQPSPGLALETHKTLETHKRRGKSA